MLVGNHDIYFKNTNDINSLQELIGQEQEDLKSIQRNCGV